MGFAIYMPKNPNRIYVARTCTCSLIGIIVFVVISTIYCVGEINSKLIEVGLRFLSVFSIVFLVRGIFENSAVGSFWRYLSKYSFPIFLMHTIFAAGIRIVLLKIGIDLGGSHIGVGLIEGVELKETADVFFTEEDRKDRADCISHICG